MDTPTIQTRLTALLADVVSATDGTGPAEFDPNAEFADLGVNSIDLMEFVIRIEQEFDVVLLDDMMPEDLPLTIAGWTAMLESRLPAS